VREKHGELDEAVSDYTRAIDLRPREAAAYYSRGKARLRLKMNREACEDLRKAGSLGWKASSDIMNACHE
jgi:tetratricopeptide (TPR) repeat protein